MAKFKVGDRVKVVKDMPDWKDGQSWVKYMSLLVGETGKISSVTDKRYCRVCFENGECWSFPYESLAPADSLDQYIGRPAIELPDGTVCDIDSAMAYRVIIIGGQLFNVDKDDNKTGGGWTLNNYPVIRIHKLGEPRPKRLRDDPQVVWRDGQGSMVWASSRREPKIMHYNDGYVYPLHESYEDTIASDWTRLGPIEGIVIGGKVCGKEAE